MKTFKQYLAEENQNVQCDINGICKVIKQYESAGNEEKILGVYKDSKNLDTIGHGHLVTPESEQIFKEVFPEEHKKDPNFGSSVLRKGARLTPEQADVLMLRDVTKRLPAVKKLVPKFETYSPELQSQLASEHFRGMLGKSPTAVKHLNAGNFAEAGKEFLNASDYRKSVKEKTGIAARMKALSDAMMSEPTRQKKPAK
jgi:GH24 family phage-related lysozyme (muramidase)